MNVHFETIINYGDTSLQELEAIRDLDGETNFLTALNLRPIHLEYIPALDWQIKYNLLLDYPYCINTANAEIAEILVAVDTYPTQLNGITLSPNYSWVGQEQYPSIQKSWELILKEVPDYMDKRILLELDSFADVDSLLRIASLAEQVGFSHIILGTVIPIDHKEYSNLLIKIYEISQSISIPVGIFGNISDPKTISLLESNVWSPILIEQQNYFQLFNSNSVYNEDTGDE